MFGGGWILPNGNCTEPTRVMMGINEFPHPTLPLVSTDFNNNEVSEEDLMNDYLSQLDIDVHDVDLDPTFVNDGSVLSEAVSLISNQDGDVTLNGNVDDLLEIKMEIEDEPSEIQPDLSSVDCFQWNGAFNQELENLINNQPPNGNEILVPVITVSSHEPVKRKSRKQDLKPSTSSACSGYSQYQVNEITTTSINNHTPVTNLKKKQKEPKSAAKPKPAKPPKITPTSSRGFTNRSRPLYLMKRSDCKDNQEWQRAKRAQNTKQFHEKQKKKLQAAEEVLMHLITHPACRKEFDKPELKLKLELFPEILKNLKK